MKRREFISLFGAAAVWPVTLRAQQKTPRIGFLGANNAANYATQLAGFRSGLRDFGYIEGQNINIDFRWADGDYNRLVPLAAELAALKVDVIVTHGTPGTSVAKEIAAAIPIVMATSGDADITGLIQNLARPGGNVTGLTYFAAEQVGKRLELVKEVVPAIGRVAFLTNPENPLMRFDLDAAEKAARSMNLVLQSFEVRSPDEFDGAFSTMTARGLEAVEVDQDGMLTANAKKIAATALKHRMASVGEAPFAAAGGLVGFGPNFAEMFRRSAYFVDRLLKGAKAADLPVERPTKFELVTNLKTAKLLGLTIPPSMLVRADKVIE